jgi:predicted ABC-type ATPase
MASSDPRSQGADRGGFIAACTIIGGPNGSGKSSIFAALKPPGEVSKGGHGIPDPIVRRRYEVSLSRLVEAIRIAHGTLVYDNSGISQELLLQIEGDAIEANNLDTADTFHIRIAKLVGTSLGIDVSEVLRAARMQHKS